MYFFCWICKIFYKFVAISSILIKRQSYSLEEIKNTGTNNQNGVKILNGEKYFAKNCRK